jgi:hypothetical protein
MLFSSNGEVNFNKISGGNKILVRILLNFCKKVKKITNDFKCDVNKLRIDIIDKVP